MTNVTLTLLEDTIIKDYCEERTTIDLSFMTIALINKLNKMRNKSIDEEFF